MINNNGYRLIRNWTPVVPDRIPKSMRPNAEGKWGRDLIDWFKRVYPGSEDDQLAYAIDCSTETVRSMARKCHLLKSKAFLKWKNSDPEDQDPTAPVGYHWETEEERQQRLRELREREEGQARRIAKTFDFATPEEKEKLTAAMYAAIVWARESEEESDV